MKKTFVSFLLLCVCFSLSAVVNKDTGIYINNIPAISITTEGQEPFSYKAPSDLGRPSVAVVLSGGGARGVAHISVLEALEEKGIPVDMVMGTSMGALIGGLYSAGYSAGDIRRLVTENDLTELFSQIFTTDYQPLIEPFEDSRFNVLSVALTNKNVGETSGIISDKKILDFFHKILSRIPEDISFDDLAIPFRAVATDATSGDYVLFEGGSLVDAMRSSMSIPLVFDAYEVEGLYLLDGGMVDNMPIAYARSLGYDIVIGVNMNESLHFNEDDMQTLTGAANASFNLIVINTIRNQYSSADIIFNPDVADIAVLDFSNTEEILQRGTAEVLRQEEALDEIAALFADLKLAKDPNRVGSYFYLPEDSTSVTGETWTSEAQTTESKVESTSIQWSNLITNEEKKEAMSSSRLLLGVSGVSEVYTQMNGKSPVLLQIIADMQSQFFLKKMCNTDWDLSIGAYFGDNITLGADFYYPLLGENSKLYFKPSISFSTGSVSTLSNRANPTPVNVMDFKTNLEMSFKYTDGKCYNLNAGFEYNLYVLGRTSSSLDSSCFGVPNLFFNGIWYGNYEQNLFATNGLRLDFTTSIGICNKEMVYKLGFAYKQSIPITAAFSLSLDATAFSSREPLELMSSYMKYGGWDGIVGNSNSLYVRDFVTFGVSAQYGLGGFLPAFLIGQIRAGWRSEYDAFLIASSGISSGNDCTAPFSELRTFDMGFGFGYGVQTPICDLVIGLGVSITGNFAIYFKVY